MSLSERQENYQDNVYLCHIRKNTEWYNRLVLRETSINPHQQDSFEMQADSIRPGQTVIVVDDLIATGKEFYKISHNDCGLTWEQVVQLRLLASLSLNKAAKCLSISSSLNSCSWKAVPNSTLQYTL